MWWWRQFFCLTTCYQRTSLTPPYLPAHLPSPLLPPFPTYWAPPYNPSTPYTYLPYHSSVQNSRRHYTPRTLRLVVWRQKWQLCIKACAGRGGGVLVILKNSVVPRGGLGRFIGSAFNAWIFSVYIMVSILLILFLPCVWSRQCRAFLPVAARRLGSDLFPLPPGRSWFDVLPVASICILQQCVLRGSFTFRTYAAAAGALRRRAAWPAPAACCLPTMVFCRAHCHGSTCVWLPYTASRACRLRLGCCFFLP